MKSIDLNHLRTCKQMITIACLAICSLALGTSQCHAQGQSLTWTNTNGDAADNFFQIDANWDLGSAPQAQDAAVFLVDTGYSVFWDSVTGDRTVDSFVVFDGDVTFTNSSNDATRYNLAVTNHALLFGEVTIRGIQLDAQQSSEVRGTLTVDGSAMAGSSVNTGSDLLFRIGGGMIIRNGGVVTTGRDADVGDSMNNDRSTIVITGASSQWNIAGELTTGVNGPAVIGVRDGGLLTSNGALIGADAPVSVTGVDSQWFNMGSLTINRNFTIGDSGTVMVTGTVQNNDAIFFRDSGATLVAPAGITNNNIIDASGGDSVIQGSIANTRFVNVDNGASLTITGDLTHSADLIDETTGLFSGGTIRIAGSYNGGSTHPSSSAEGGVVVPAGDYRPADVDGPETGLVVFRGTSLQMESTTTTFIDLAATDDHDVITAVDFDGDFQGNPVIVHPNFTLAGDLQVNLLDGFTLAPGQIFQIISFDSQQGTISGTFDNFAEGDVVLSDNGVALVISYVGGDGDDVVLTTGQEPTPPPANDDFENRQFISIGSFSNAGATTQPGEPQLDATGKTLWFTFTSPEISGTLTLTTLGSDFDTQVHVYEVPVGGGFADLIPVTENNDAGGGTHSEVTFEYDVTTEYAIRVGGFDDGNGPAMGAFPLDFENEVNEPKGILSGSFLRLLATDEDDNISLTRTGVPGQVSLVVNGCPEEIYNDVEVVLIDGFGGDDTIVVDVPGATIDGGDGDDEITVTAPGGSQIFGGNGNDVITGGPGADTIMGGPGMDDIDGMGGADSIYGNSDIDLTDTNQNILSGGDGNDFIEGTDRVDLIDGGRGSDEIFGHQGSDVIDGFHGNDCIDGGSGADDIKGGLGNDEIFGGPGNDIILGQAGQDTLLGGTGIDNISGGLNNDTIFGQGGDDVLLGNEGADTLFGGTGDDELLGGTGNDTLNGQGGSDNMLGQGGDDHFIGGLGLDTFNGGQGNDTAVDSGEAGEINIENS